MKVDPNDDIVPTLRMFNGLMMERAANEITSLRTRITELEDLLSSARVICQREGKETAWERFDRQIAKHYIGAVTAKTFRILPSDVE